MRAYNVEFFDIDMNLVAHTNVNEPKYNADYLSNARNNIEIPSNPNIEEGNYIRIVKGSVEYFGVIDNVEYTGIDDSVMKLEYISFIDYFFDTKIMFDTNLQGSIPLETCLANIIKSLWVNNSDQSQNLKGLTVETTSTTSSWGFNLKSDTEGKHHCIIGFRDTLIKRSATSFYVFINVHPDFQNKKITLNIGVNQKSPVLIETVLPNIISRRISLKKTTNTLNKLVVYNTANYTDTRVYFLHSNGKFDRNNVDRLVPVSFDTTAVSVNEGSTFAKEADSAAAEAFGQVSYNNLIELELSVDDKMIVPRTLELGQLVNVIHDGRITASILTGFEIDKTITLIFGTVRLDLTKILKRG